MRKAARGSNRLSSFEFVWFFVCVTDCVYGNRAHSHKECVTKREKKGAEKKKGRTFRNMRAHRLLLYLYECAQVNGSCL